MRSNEALGTYLLSVTVQIRHSKLDRPVGTGVIVSTDGVIATCKHVVEEAGVSSTGFAHQCWLQFLLRSVKVKGEVGIHFPKVGDRAAANRRAIVLGRLDQYDDDIVLLKLTEAPPYLGPESVAVLGRAEASFGNRFWALGFPRLRPERPPHSASGEIQIWSEYANYLGGRVQLTSSGLEKGISGAPVLDAERDLIVGFVSEIWDSRGKPQNRDLGWAVNARVLGSPPFNLPINEENRTLRAAPVTQADLSVARAVAARREHIAWNGGQDQRSGLVNRAAPIDDLTRDWEDDHIRVSLWVGAPGEGKSSLARQWLDLLREKSTPQPDGIFWWSCGLSGTSDEFFDKAIRYLATDEEVFRGKGAREKAHDLAALLYAGRYVFVIDQLDAVQSIAEDETGVIQNRDLGEFLKLFAEPRHDSFCLITSRMPAVELMPYLASTLAVHYVNRLSPGEGRELLREAGAMLSDKELDRLVEICDGNALMLALVGGIVASEKGAKWARQLGRSVRRSTESAQLRALLRKYDESLEPAARGLLIIAAVFRGRVNRAAFEGAIENAAPGDSIAGDLAALGYLQRSDQIGRLNHLRLLAYDSESATYTLHTELKRYYSESALALPDASLRALHRRIYAYHVAMAPPELPEQVTLDDLAPLFEAVHHAAKAGDFDLAFQAYERVSMPPKGILIRQLGAVSTDLALLKEFFPNGDLDREPLVSDGKQRAWLINEAGICAAAEGNLARAIQQLRRAVEYSNAVSMWLEAGTSAINRAGMHALAGDYRSARTCAAAGHRFGWKDADLIAVRKQSLAMSGWVAALRGRLTLGLRLFKLARELDGGSPLQGVSPARYAEILFQMGQVSEGRKIAAELTASTSPIPMRSMAHRILAVLDNRLTEGERQKHFDEAVRLARMMSRREVLIEALVWRGCWSASAGSQEMARADLEQALSYSIGGGYRMFEGLARLGLAALQKRKGMTDAAAQETAAAENVLMAAGYGGPRPV